MRQVFSEGIVEKKRHYRTLFAVISGMSVAAAKRAGQIDTSSINVEEEPNAKQHSMFVDEDEDEDEPSENISQDKPSDRSVLNPAATVFSPQIQSTHPSPISIQTEQPRWMTHFGQKRSPDSASPGGISKSVFTPAKDSKFKSLAPSPFGTTELISSAQSEDNSSLNSTLSQPSTISAPVTNVQHSNFSKVPLDATSGFNIDFDNKITSKTTHDSISNPLSQATSLPEPDNQINSTKANSFFTSDASSTLPQSAQHSKLSEVTSTKPFAPVFQVTRKSSHRLYATMLLTAI